MADDLQHDTEIITRKNLAYIWTFSIIAFVAYVVVRFGEKMEILTLLIGFITGVGSTILAVYFGAPFGKKQPDPTATFTGDSPNVTVNPSPPDKPQSAVPTEQ